MTELAAIKQALLHAAEEAVGVAPAWRDHGPGPRLDELIHAVATSILPRDIVLEWEEGSKTVLHASEGRLFHVSGIGPATAKTQEAILHHLSALAEDGGALGYRTRAAETLPDGIDRGLGAAELARALGRIFPVAPSTTSPDLPEGTDCALLATEEAFELLTGDPKEAEALAHWASPVLDDLMSKTSPIAASLETDGAVAFGWSADPSCHLVISGRLGRIVIRKMRGPLAQ